MWPNGCSKQDCIVVPPTFKYYGSKKNKKHLGQNRTLIKYKSKQITTVALDSYMAMIF